MSPKNSKLASVVKQRAQKEKQELSHPYYLIVRTSAYSIGLQALVSCRGTWPGLHFGRFMLAFMLKSDYRRTPTQLFTHQKDIKGKQESGYKTTTVWITIKLVGMIGF